jgi:CubicO group peptidase (beta-lactamase class C family)
MTTPDLAALETASDIGLCADRLAAAGRLVAGMVADGYLGAAVLRVGRGGRFLAPMAFGRLRPAPEAPPVDGDSIFLVASITKPVTATAVVMLAEDGALSLEQPVTDFIPEFGQRGKEGIRLWHLLTHTSGLPDMLPQNVRLRERHAGLAQFVEGICECDLLFAPGTNVRYQSMGIMILGEIVARVAGMPLPEFMQRRIFAPAGMRRTSLGLREDQRAAQVDVLLPANQVGTVWHMNTDYWRGMGAPWGGLLAPAGDIATFVQMFLDDGLVGQKAILSPAGAGSMIRDQLRGRSDLPALDRYRSSWGLGWELRSPLFGDLTSPRTFGHGGANGTVAWADPERALVFVFLSNQPRVWQQDRYLLSRLSNLVVAACV